ncbi:tyrosine-protein kinase SRK3 [Chanos chanos]|uniref:Tyrosine-protein kinase n=1 Tax=Chanos chanos TaxID=29144 RepID=A0A6J2WHY5_CHACN|nr:tyrosine-protein kinase SRK3-like [Chanos chanos]
MGNSLCSCKKRCCLMCMDQEEPEKPRRVFKSVYDYPRRTLRDLKLKKGDTLEVIDETEHWLYVRKCTIKGENTRDSICEEGYVPREFIKPADSLEAEPWYFESIKKRTDAKRCLLRPENGEGAFLVWKSEENNQYYLSVKNGPHARHYRITEKNDEKRFYLVSRKTFQTISDLVCSYSQHQDGLCVQLTKPCVMLDTPALHTLSFEEEWEVERSSLRKVEKLGSGEFAEVWHGIWNDTTDVAIKEFKDVSPDILTEIAIMKELHHERLLKLYAVCTVSRPICIITELMKNGSLKKFLCSHKEARDIEFSLSINFAVQITEGLTYLETKKIIHRDLRADNILLTDMLSCKIADFGLAQFTFSGGEKITKGIKLPVKWMAPEIFSGEQYTNKSDVWSFGIVLMEIITYGDEPYPDKDKLSCIRDIQKGHRMAKPLDCPQELYDIMLLCWGTNPAERPAYRELQDMLMTLIPEPLSELE